MTAVSVEPHIRARTPAPRIAAVDTARGAALIAMFVYHLVWDLGFFQFIDDSIPLSDAMHLYAHVVASAFLILVGVSLVLAGRHGMNWGAFAERLVWIALAAGAITLGTAFLFPQAFIFFGILHCIAAASLLALPFTRLPAWLGALGIVACFAAPKLLASAAFNGPGLWWVGLSTHAPITYDYRPVLPWLGMVIAGVLIARLVLRQGGAAAWLRWSPRGAVLRTIAWGGRRSLLVYLLHQPIFLGVLFLVFQVTGPSVDVEAHPFVANCDRQCIAAGAMPRTCEAACRCIVDRSRSSGLWSKILADKLSSDDTMQFDRLRVDCVRLPEPQPAAPSVK